MKKITRQTIRSIYRKREPDSHKGSYGHALLIAGSKGCMGAAVIAAKAGLRAGAGLLSVDVPKDEATILQVSVPEAMLVFRENNNLINKSFSAAGIGPGLSLSQDNTKLVSYYLSNFGNPLILDADALNCIAANKKLLKQIPPGTIITPHPKEFDRLFGQHADTPARIKTAIEQAEALQIVIVLKGHHTLITSGGKSFINTTGNAGLAKGGSGDALTGMITSFLAQGYIALHAAILAVYLHGLAADIALKEQSMESMLITDVIECLGKAFKQLD